jgi:hypothetical protein
MNKLAGLLTLLLLPGVLWAYNPLKDETDSHDYVPEEEWHEGEVDIPQSFNDEDLQSFRVDEQDTRFSYFIERASLHTGEDFVTRYVLVIRSSQGAINSSFEGLRCGYRQYKVYAYGNADKLTPMPGSDWQAVPKGASADYRTRLYDDLICNLQTGHANPPAAVFKAMRDNKRVNTPFLSN